MGFLEMEIFDIISGLNMIYSCIARSGAIPVMSEIFVGILMADNDFVLRKKLSFCHL